MNRKAVLSLLGAILGIGLLIVFAFVLSGWFRTMRLARESAPVSQQPQPVSAPKGSEEQPPSTPQTPEQVDPTAGWRTYTDTEVGISLKYPPDWILKPGTYVDTSNNFYEISFDQSYDPIYRGIAVLVSNNLNKLDTKAFIQQQAIDVGGQNTKLQLSMKEINIGGLPAVKVQGIPGAGNISVFVPRGSRMYRFSLHEGREGILVEPENEDVFEQMLRTVIFK